MSHVPKRATQHGVFLSSAEVIPTQLKPGQKSLDRQLYTEEAKQLRETFVNPNMPEKSDYTRNLGSILKPDDFRNPTRPIRQSEPSDYSGYSGTGHWRSESHSNLNEGSVSGAKYHRQGGPSYQASNPPTCISRVADPTTYRDTFCKSCDEMFHSRSVLALGTPKGTLHIPGYQGFLALNTRNPYVARVEMGGGIRSVDKSNITEQFHLNTLNYTGHEPRAASSVYTGVAITTKTVAGRDYTTPPLFVFP